MGLGAALFDWAIAEARRRGCALLQLTTASHDATRTAPTSASDSSRLTRATSSTS